ncbi:MAG: oxygen-dependent coproporphyrinogen oxidase [Chlamydiia bacterium]|nr:oxygen-dependent coproporphyrinogen oxidase [Chlamydiia bacterium]
MRLCASETIIDYLTTLRADIMRSFESLEEESTFVKTAWDYAKGTGGGEMGVIHGKVLEKGAVNFSAVSGDNFPMQDGSGPFFATGVSLITHMQNPHMPTVHMNVRYIESGDTWWFGGGYDLTPMGFPYNEDTEHFHQTAQNAIPEHYPAFSQNAKDYFYIPHRKKERGVGGIFFDHYNTGDLEKDFELMQTVGNSFLPAIMPIYQRRQDTPYTPEDKELQQSLRAHYVEFNLIYDRGTQFGFRSGGNPEAILCSMPPCAKWL